MTRKGITALAAFAIAWFAQTPTATADPQSRAEAGGMNIRIVADGREINASLEDSAAARDFADLLPLELTLSDYHGIEKVADLPSRLSTDDAPEGIDPDVGDITYYAPWGNLAIFYRDFGYSRGLVRLGRITDGVQHLENTDSVNARIELAPERS